MKLSVIIPCYQAETYLAACLDALLAQDEADFEAILVDDGSTDGTAVIAQAYAERDGRIRFIRQENAGVSAARNAGLRIACGEWVLFVDADDLLPERALSTLLAHAKDGVDMVVGLHETFDEQGCVRTEIPETCWMDRQGERRRRAVALRLIEGDAVLNIMCNKLHRRALLVGEGLMLDPGVRIAEDALFNLEAVLCGGGIAFCGSVTYRYRIHSASATQTRAKSEFDTHLPWFVSMKQMLKKRGVFEMYYGAYFASIVLRLYKDGGVSGVMRDFVRLARPLLLDPARGKLSLGGRMLFLLAQTGLYPAVYPLTYPFETAKRKAREAMCLLRAGRDGRG